MKSQRPVNMAVTDYLPVAAIASIMHRITGVLLFVGVGILLWLLQTAMASQAGFEQARAWLAQPLLKLLLIAVLGTLAYHFVAGIKHLLLDWHIGDTYPATRAGSIAVIVISIAATVAAGVWLW